MWFLAIAFCTVTDGGPACAMYKAVYPSEDVCEAAVVAGSDAFLEQSAPGKSFVLHKCVAGGEPL